MAIKICVPRTWKRRVQSSMRHGISTIAGIAIRSGRPLPGQDLHLLEQRTLARHTWTNTGDILKAEGRKRLGASFPGQLVPWVRVPERIV